MGIVRKKRIYISEKDYNIQDGGSKKYKPQDDYTIKKPSFRTKLYSSVLATKSAISSPIGSRYSKWIAKRKERSASLNYTKKITPSNVKRTWYGVRKFTNSSKFNRNPKEPATLKSITTQINKVKSNPFELQRAKRALDKFYSKEIKEVDKLRKTYKKKKNNTTKTEAANAELALATLKTEIDTEKAKINRNIEDLKNKHKHTLENKQKSNSKYINNKAQHKIVTDEIAVLNKQLDKTKDIGRINVLQTQIKTKTNTLTELYKAITNGKKNFKNKKTTSNVLNALTLLNKSSKYSQSITKYKNRINSEGLGVKYAYKDYLQTFKEAKDKGIGSFNTLRKLAKESTTGRILASPWALKRGIVRGVSKIGRGSSALSRTLKLNTIGRGTKYVLRNLARATPARWMGVKSVNHIAKKKLASALSESNKIGININKAKLELQRITSELQIIDSNPFSTHSDMNRRKLEKDKAKYINEYENLKSKSKTLVRTIDSIETNLPNAIEISGKVEKNINSLLISSEKTRRIEDISKLLTNTGTGTGTTLLASLGLQQNSIEGIDNLVENLKDPSKPINVSNIKSSIDSIMLINEKITKALGTNTTFENKPQLFAIQYELNKHKIALQKLYANNNELQEFTTNKQVASITSANLNKNTKLASTSKISSTSITATYKDQTDLIKTKTKNFFTEKTYNFDENLTKLPNRTINIRNKSTNIQIIINTDSLLKGLTTEGHKDSIAINNIINNIINNSVSKTYINETDVLHEIKQKYVEYKLHI